MKSPLRIYQIGLLVMTAVIASGAGANTEPMPPAQPITIGTTYSIQSTPPGYAKNSGKRYPVLYVVDGGVEQDLLNVAGVALNGGMWGRSAEGILVGIETKDRRRELVGKTTDPELLKK